MTTRALVTPLNRGAADIRKRVLVLLIGVLVLAAAAIGKLAIIQLVSPSEYATYGENQRETLATRESLRGDLLDRNGAALAISVYRPSIVADPSLLDADDVRLVVNSLSPVLGITPEELARILGEGGRFQYLDRLVDPAVAEQVRALALPGIFVKDEPERFYPQGGGIAEALVGRSDDFGDGVSGLELTLQDRLEGEAGTTAWETSAYGTIPGTERVVDAPVPGADIVLAIDLPLQHECEQALIRALQRTGSDKGTAIVSDPATGEILAMASVSRDADGTPMVTSQNLAVTFLYEPASVMKPLTFAASFEMGAWSPDVEVYVPEVLEIYDQEFTDDEDNPDYMTPTGVLVHSSNIGTIEIAEALGSAGVHQALENYGFGEITASGLPQEEQGILNPLAEWESDGTTWAAAAIGQSVGVTPLQMLMAYNVLANDGEYVAPRVVLGTRDDRGELVPEPSVPSRRVLSAENANTVTEMMVRVVRDGTAQAAQVDGYDIAAKTGTAQKPQDGGGYEDADGRRHYVTTVAGFFPAEDPLYSMIVVLDEPKGQYDYYASDTTAPLFGELAAWILQHYNVAPPGELVVGDADYVVHERAEVPLTQAEAAALPCDDAATDDSANGEDGATADPTAGAPDEAAADGGADSGAESGTDGEACEGGASVDEPGADDGSGGAEEGGGG